MRKILFIIIIINSFLSAQMSPTAKNKLQSLILPGLGELNMGNEERARSFFIREAALWLICIGGKKASSWYESDYRAFAELHASVDMAGKDYIFAVNMGHYGSLSEYNATKARKRQVDKIYKDGQGNEWEWDNTENRLHFDKLRIQSLNYDKYARFAIGGLVLHRFISLIDVIVLERRQSKVSLTPQFSTNGEDLQFKLHLDL